MARSHSPNPDFYRHCQITERAISEYQVQLDDSADDFEFRGNMFQSNKLHYWINESNNRGYCLGEFVFDTNPKIYLSIKKEMSLRKIRGKFESKTDRYKYNIMFEKNYKHTSKQCVVRWDNQDDSYGYDSTDHLHIQIDSEANSHRKYSMPAHGENCFPYASDAFLLIQKFIQQDNIYKYYEGLLNKFVALSNQNKKTITLWVPVLDQSMNDNFFQEIYL